jgi:hypothetical protein
MIRRITEPFIFIHKAFLNIGVILIKYNNLIMETNQYIPIVFLYRGNRNFIPFTLYQAKMSNPNSRIILLGDQLNRHYSRICEHYLCDDYLEYSKELKKVYKHKSQWGEDFEYVCIERWLYL